MNANITVNDSSLSKNDQTLWSHQSIATWRYRVEDLPTGVDLLDDHSRAHWLADCISHVLRALSGFARVNIYDVATFSHGDGSFVPASTETELPTQLDEYLRSTTDIYYVSLVLDFIYLDIDADSSVRERLSHKDGYLLLTSNVNAGKIIEGEDHYIDLSFIVENSIFSPISHGRDNRALAILNAPRLRVFTKRLAQYPDLVFKEVDCDSNFVSWMRDHDLFDNHGFKIPEDIEAFERLLKELNEEV